MINFFSFLDDSSYFMDEMGEIILTTPAINFTGTFLIDFPIRISSNCNTVIKCHQFQVSSDIISFSSIIFETPLIVEKAKQFSIANCTIKNTLREKAFTISNCENVSISHVTVTDSQNTGLTILNSVVKADNLSIYNIQYNLMTCNCGSIVKLTNCNFKQAKEGCVYVFGQTSIEIENCTFSDAGFDCIYLNSSKIKIKNCTFRNNKRTGISLKYSTDFLIENNQFTNIKETAIFIEKNSIGTITGNSISDCNGNGITIYESDVLVKENNVENTDFPAFSIAGKTTATLLNNKIAKMKRHGICVRNASHANLEGTEINDCQFCGISISNTNFCSIQNNSINNCKLSAIEIFNNSKVIAKKNVITNIHGNAFSLFIGSSIDAEENQISNIEAAMAKLAFKSGGNFINNQVSNCRQQFEGETSSFYYFSGNSDFENLTNDRSRIGEFVHLDDRVFDEKTILCLKCHKNKRDTFFSPCGHRVMCKKCADEEFAAGEVNSKFVCPLCNFDVSKVMAAIEIGNEESDNLCIMCMENKIDGIIMPCGHVAACTACLEKWFEKHKNCPVCRHEQSEFLKIYNDF